MTRPEILERIERLGAPKTLRKNPAEFVASALRDRGQVEALRPLAPGEAVFDLGCGYGRLACAFAGTDVNYAGVDVHAGRLRYATRLFRDYPNCTFARSEAANARYNPGGEVRVSREFPRPEAGYAAAFAISLFTHVPDPAEARAYLRELARLVPPGGVLLSTWLTAPAEGRPASDAYHAHHDRDAVVSWLRKARFGLVHASGEGTRSDQLRLLCRRGD
jgi:SAM-dependent methyltransferase